jgi:hypothetical protein
MPRRSLDPVLEEEVVGAPSAFDAVPFFFLQPPDGGADKLMPLLFLSFFFFFFLPPGTANLILTVPFNSNSSKCSFLDEKCIKQRGRLGKEGTCN